MFVPVTVYGNKGAAECLMMLDTGASVSVLPLEVIESTGSDDLIRAPTATFQTANGPRRYPLVERVLVVEGIESTLQIAVSRQDALPLLGVDFFEGREYLIDSRSSALYIWEK